MMRQSAAIGQLRERRVASTVIDGEHVRQMMHREVEVAWHRRAAGR